jgi:hypothetical protein
MLRYRTYVHAYLTPALLVACEVPTHTSVSVLSIGTSLRMVSGGITRLKTNNSNESDNVYSSLQYSHSLRFYTSHWP